MIFSKLFKKKKEYDEEDRISEESRYVKLKDTEEAKHQVVDMCEQIIDAAREYEDAREEYSLVTSYLNDIQLIEDMAEEKKEKLTEIASNVSKLNNARNEFLQTEHKLSDVQFSQMQEIEDELPKTINRLKSNESYLDSIKRDLNYLEGEKTSWRISKEDSIKEQKQLRSIAIVLMIFFALSAVSLLIASHYLNINTQLSMIILAFVAVLIGTYAFVRYQDCGREIKKCEVNWNHAVSLENHVKIKYVNMKNAVDYTCERFHVKNAYELNYNYEQYMDMVREREKFRRTNDDLERYNNQLIMLLQKEQLHDARVWLNYSNALVDKKEMVELKHDLLSRRQKLRGRMEYNISIMTELRSNILLHKNELGDRVEQVNKILRKVSEINANMI